MRLAPIPQPEDDRHGEIRKEGAEQGRARDARAQARHAQVRTLRQKSDEPEAGHRDWPERSAPCRRQGSEEKDRRPEAQGRAHEEPLAMDCAFFGFEPRILPYDEELTG